jgi:predicted nucleic acid-binding protein
LIRDPARYQCDLGPDADTPGFSSGELAAHRAADLAAERKARGRQVDLRDTLIAGIALARGAQLATRNTRHFSDTSISLINPFAP